MTLNRKPRKPTYDPSFFAEFRRQFSTAASRRELATDLLAEYGPDAKPFERGILDSGAEGRLTSTRQIEALAVVAFELPRRTTRGAA